MGWAARGNKDAGVLAGGVPLISDAPAVVLDAYGRVLSVGDLVELYTTPPPAFMVESIRSVTVPNGPPLMDVVIRARIPLRAARNRPVMEVVRVLDRDEAQRQAAAQRAARGNVAISPVSDEPPADPSLPFDPVAESES